MVIKSGNSGNVANVTNNKQLEAFSETQDEQHYINVNSGEVWTLPVEAVTNTGADDYFFYFKNTNSEDLFLSTVRVKSTLAGTIRLKLVTGAQSGGTAVTPVNRNAGKTPVLDATVEQGVNITGLTDGGTIATVTLEANKQGKMSIASTVVISPGKAVALLANTATMPLEFYVTVYKG